LIIFEKLLGNIASGFNRWDAKYIITICFPWVKPQAIFEYVCGIVRKHCQQFQPLERDIL
jgi:hypothetical protein